MRKVFIDLGSYKGDTIKEFYNWTQLIDDPTKFEIFAFEPNPDLETQMKKLANNFRNVSFKAWAAWINDGTIQLAVDKTATPMGSTVMNSKSAIWDNFPHIQVKCFDFSKWLKNKFSENDEIIVKMDIEGAEFKVLEKMLADGTINLIDYLFVEFHPNKVRDYTSDDANDLVQRILDAGGNLKLWH